MRKQKNKMQLWMGLLLAVCMVFSVGCGGDEPQVSESGKMEIADPNEGLGGDVPGGYEYEDIRIFEGNWVAYSVDSGYDSIEFDNLGNWTLYSGNDIFTGYTEYEPDDEAFYAYCNEDGTGSLLEIDADGDLYLSSYGYFQPAGGETYNGKGHEGLYDNNASDIGDPGEYINDLYQRDLSVFAGTWYYDGDLAANSFIVIDDSGNWSYYERAQGDPEAQEMDYGTLIFSDHEVSTYYAISDLYDSVSYRVFEFDNGAILWGDEGLYYEKRE